MPKLIVYVKADTWRRVVAQAGEDAPALARALSVEAIEEFVAGLTERDEVAQGPSTDGNPSGTSRSVSFANVGAGTIQPAADSPDPHFRPDPK